MNESTWAGTHVFGAQRILYPTSTDEAAALVQREYRARRRVHALGTRHSFNDVADSNGTLISLIDVPAEPELVDDGSAVHVSSGIRYGELATWLEARGKALHNMGSLPHISVAGAMSTGTHGSGDSHGVLATAVREIEWLDATGNLHRRRRGEPDFDGLVIGLGAYGIVTAVTLDVEPSYLVRQDVYVGVSWATLLENLDQMTASASSISFFTTWDEPVLEQVWVKRRLREASGTVPEHWFGGARELGRVCLVGSSENLTAHGVAGPWLEHLPHFRVDSPPSHGNEIQTEYFVARSRAAPAIAALHKIRARIAPLLHVTELRTIAADQLWLSPAFDEDVLAIHFTWRNELAAVMSVLPGIEQRLARYDARPHWGKVHSVPATDIGRVYSRRDDSRELFEALDPSGTFTNSYLERVGLRKRLPSWESR